MNHPSTVRNPEPAAFLRLVGTTAGASFSPLQQLTSTNIYFEGLEGLRALQSLGSFEVENPAPFFCSHLSSRIGERFLRRISVSTVAVSLKPSEVTANTLRFSYLVSGSITLNLATGNRSVEPGGALLTWANDPSSFTIDELSVVVLIDFPSELLLSRGIAVPAETHLISVSSGLPRGIAALVMECIKKEHFPMDPAEAARLGRTVDSLMCGLYLTLVSEAVEPDDRQTDLRSKVLAHLDSRERTGYVTVPQIANHFNLSVRTLQRTFERHERTLREEIAARGLTQPRPGTIPKHPRQPNLSLPAQGQSE